MSILTKRKGTPRGGQQTGPASGPGEAVIAAKATSRPSFDRVFKCRLFLVVVALGTTVSCGGDSPTSPSGGSTPDIPSPASSTVTLTGFVRETAPTETVPVADARVEVIDPATGLLTGQFVLTDSRGFYRFPGLSGAVSFRASKDGYEGTRSAFS